MSEDREQQECSHPWHSNPGLIIPCPECGCEIGEPDSFGVDTDQQPTEAPEKIWAGKYRDGWHVSTGTGVAMGNDAQYIRGDLYESLQRQLDDLQGSKLVMAEEIKMLYQRVTRTESYSDQAQKELREQLEQAKADSEMRFKRMEYATEEHAKLLVVNADLRAENTRLTDALRECARKAFEGEYGIEDTANEALKQLQGEKV